MLPHWPHIPMMPLKMDDMRGWLVGAGPWIRLWHNFPIRSVGELACRRISKHMVNPVFSNNRNPSYFCLHFFFKEEVRVRSGHPRFCYFAWVLPEKRLDLKNLKRQTKAEDLGTRDPQFLSLRLSLKAL